MGRTRSKGIIHHSNVIALPTRKKRSHYLIAQDRQDVADFHLRAEAAGYGELLIHDVHPAEGLPWRDYVSAYRRGEAWSTWGFARHGHIVCAWSALSSEDAGNYKSMLDALERVILRGRAVRSGDA